MRTLIGLLIVLILIVLSLMYYLGNAELVTKEKKCVYGPWLPCDNGIHKRHEILANAEERDSFTCGKPPEEKPCSKNRVCTMDMKPVCACVEYDINNQCVKTKRYSNRCDANMLGEPLELEQCENN